jgi:alpha-mannosidase
MWTEIPYGALLRERYEMDSTRWNNAGGDWPAVGWAAIEHDGLGLAVLNRGTPSHRCEDGALLISVLRSPAFPNCLEEPQSYSAPDYDRMRDPGRHVFEHRVVPYAGRWQDAGIVELAEAFHTPLPLGRVTIRDICKLTGANRNTVKVHLKTLVQRRLLFREGTGKGSWYRP